MNFTAVPDWRGALIAGAPFLLTGFVVWVSLKRDEARDRARAKHPAKGTLSLDESVEWERITGVLASEMDTEGRR